MLEPQGPHPIPFFLSILPLKHSLVSLLMLYFPCLSDLSKFLLLILPLRRCPFTQSFQSRTGGGVLSFLLLFTASKTSVVPSPGCQCSKFKIPPGSFLTDNPLLPSSTGPDDLRCLFQPKGYCDSCQ